MVGSWLAFLLFGSTVPSSATLPRFYSLHIFFIPALIALLLALHLGVIWRQLHTNYPGPRRTDSTIVGSSLYPTYAAKSIGLFFIVLGLIAALGGLVQIDPVWIYGPFDPTAATPLAQPDWYMGWIEGAMRLNPAYNVRFGPYLVPNVFFPAILLPMLIFAGLYTYPFLDKLIYDDQPHNVLKLPYQQPFNTALGCTVLSFLFILFVAGGDDAIAIATSGSVVAIRNILRLLVVTVPPLIGVSTYWLCKRARRRSLAQLCPADSMAPEASANAAVVTLKKST